MKPTQLALKPSCLLSYILAVMSFFRFCAGDVSAIYFAMKSRINLDDYACDGLLVARDAL